MPGVRFIFPLTLFVALLAIGCNKSGPAGGTTSATTAAGVAVNKQAEHDATTLLANIKAANTPEKRTRVIQRAMELDENGENVVPALLEALKDKTCGALGRTSERPDSTRETAVQALLSLKNKGKQALLDSGLKTLENGLKDKEPNVREHTVNAIGMIGSEASSSSDMVCKLCADQEKEVRGAAYRCLQKFKKFNAAPILRLLKHSNLSVAGEAAAALTWIKPSGAKAEPCLMRSNASRAEGGGERSKPSRMPQPGSQHRQSARDRHTCTHRTDQVEDGRRQACSAPRRAATTTIPAPRSPNRQAGRGRSCLT